MNCVEEINDVGEGGVWQFFHALIYGVQKRRIMGYVDI